MLRRGTRIALRKKRSIDDVLNEVMTAALAARDRGEQPDMDFVYRTTQEKLYENEHGEKPPSKDNNFKQHIPPAPTNMRRLTPLTLFDDDPWPVVAEPDAKADAAPAAEGDEPKVEVRDVHSAIADFADATDEYAFWEQRYLEFLRDHPLGLRRALPMLTEHYKHLTHRFLRAERRFIASRDKAVGLGAKLDPKMYSKTEARIQRGRKMFVETHKSISQTTYDPVNMNKAFSGKILKMTAEEFEAWKAEDRDERNELASCFDAPDDA